LAFHKDNTFRCRARIKSKNDFYALPEVAVLGVLGRKINKRLNTSEPPSEEYMVLSWLTYITLMDLMPKQLLPAVWEAAKHWPTTGTRRLRLRVGERWWCERDPMYHVFFLFPQK
jgi:hypothetical protein